MKHFSFLLLLSVPLIALAEGSSIKNLNDVVTWLLDNLINVYVIPMMIAVAMLIFFWRNIVALFNAEDTVKKADFKSYLLWAVVALTVMVSVWGVLGILTDAIGVRNAVPQLRTSEAPGAIAPGDGNGSMGDTTRPPCIPGFTECDN